MCVIVALKGDQTISHEDFSKMYDRNKDGLGFAYRANGGVQIYKGIFGKNKAWKKYEAIRTAVDGDLLIHFRRVSKGTVEIANCHPFPINETCAMVHNGTIDIPLVYSNRSDTWHFVRYLIELSGGGRHINKWLTDPVYVKALASSIGTNRLAFMDMDDFYFFGEWVTHNGYKCSNTSWKEEEKPKFQPFYMYDRSQKTYETKLEACRFSWNVQSEWRKARTIRLALDEGVWPSNDELTKMVKDGFFDRDNVKRDYSKVLVQSFCKDTVKFLDCEFTNQDALYDCYC